MSKHKPYRYLIYLALELVRRFFLLLPRRAGQLIASGLALLIYGLLPKERAQMAFHLREAFGNEKTERDIRRISRNIFLHLAHSAADVLRFPKLNRARVERLVLLEEGTRKLDEALGRRKGAIVLTGHLGNWELLASYFRFLGYPGCLVGRRIYYEPYNRVLVSLRKSGLVETIYRDESPRQLLEELRANHVVGMSADQDIDSLEGVFVPFFGRQSWTPIGPAKIAVAAKAPIVPAFMIHERSQYRLYIEDPIWPDGTLGKDEAVKQMTEKWSRIVENYVRCFPDQWVWMHDRWKTKQKLIPASKETRGAKPEQIVPEPSGQAAFFLGGDLP